VQTEPAQPSQPQAPPVNTAALNQLRDSYNELDIRFASAKSSLDNLEKKQAAMGLGLRGDIKTTATRVEYLMSEVSKALSAQDVDRARQRLNEADLALQRLEKFLGR